MKLKLVANMLVKNEELSVWYALQSILDYVDEVLVWDTGSTDRTVEIIKSIDNPKIKFQSHIASTAEEVSQLRQKMLDETHGDWLFLVDGDEVWTDRALKVCLSALVPENRFIVNRYKNLIGDVYHYQEEAAGQYQIGPFKCHVTIRFLNLNSPLHYQGIYPLEGFYDASNRQIQKTYHNEPIIDEPYLHFTHLRNSNSAVANRGHKFKYELGESMKDDFVYPKSFYYPHPEFVPSIWNTRSFSYFLNALWQTPFKILKRRIVHI